MSTQPPIPTAAPPQTASQSPPAKKRKKSKKPPDLVISAYRKHEHSILVTIDDTLITNIPTIWSSPFSFWLQGDIQIEKLDCIGTFSPTMILAAKRGGPRYDIPKTTTERKSYPIFQNMHYREIVGTVCHVSLVNGWSFQALVKRSEKYSISLLCEHQQPDGKVTLSWAKIYTHALAHLEITHPRGAHPDSDHWIQLAKDRLVDQKAWKPKPPLPSTAFINTPLQNDQTTHDQFISPFLFRPDVQPWPSSLIPSPPPPPPDYSLTPQLASAAPSPPKAKPATPPAPPKPKPIPQSEAPSPWPTIDAAKTPERTVVNAKLKIVLRSLPTFREAGDVIWFALQNEPKPLPKNLELAASPLDLVVTKKMWTGVQKKADAIKASGQDPIYIFEALVGIRSGRLAAIVSGVQLASKPPGAQ